MFAYYNNILTLPASVLIRSENNPNGLLQKCTYDAIKQRGGIKMVRRACYGQPALVSFDDLRGDIKQWVVTNYEDPRAQEKAENERIELLKHDMGYVVELDDQALSYYRTTYPAEYNVSLADNLIERYVNTARILNAILKRYNHIRATRNKCTGKTPWRWTDEHAYYESFREALNAHYPHSLPSNYRRWVDTVKMYKAEGYSCLVSEKVGNVNKNRIKGDAREWLIARWASPIEKLTLSQLLEAYNAQAQQQGWHPIENTRTLHNFLDRPEVKRLWLGMRQGELQVKNLYQRQHRTILPSVRDALWYSDGTKLNLYYLDEQGKMATCMVYEVVDAYSEVLLGYHISQSEDFEAQYQAYKMAIQFSGHKPYEIRYDNQGGHKKLNNGNFLNKLARISAHTAPYNAKSKTIESVFGRFQQQYLHKDWGFTGQNITAKKAASHANMELILANKTNLPTLAEIKKKYAERRQQWNEAPHFATGKPRIEMYLNSVNPQTPKVELWDMVDLFWLTTDKPSTYRASGIEIQVKGCKYAYEVLDTEQMPDLAFLRNNVGNKFFIKYDPDDMTMVQLYESTASGLRYVATGTPYTTIHRAKQEQTDGEATFIKAQELAAKAWRVEQQEQVEELLEQQGYHPAQHGLKMPSLRGIGKAFKQRKVASVNSADSLGTIQKEESLIVAEDLDQFALY